MIDSVATYRLTVEYEGTRYRGWQAQANARSVAGELEHALATVLGVAVELGGAGRTDAGVHALAQVAHLRVPRTFALEPTRQAVNDALPPDIHLLEIAVAPERFHARHHAVSRSYLFQVATRRTAFAKRFVWWVRRPLDAVAMREAASALVGRHDFRRFCERPEAQESTVVVVEAAEVQLAGGLILVRLVASHFLWKMVRRVVGALVEIGAGTLGRSDLVALLDPETRGALPEPAKWTAPPSGLFLERVLYPGDPPLGPLAAVTPLAPEPAVATERPRRPRRRGSE